MCVYAFFWCSILLCNFEISTLYIFLWNIKIRMWNVQFVYTYERFLGNYEFLLFRICLRFEVVDCLLAFTANNYKPKKKIQKASKVFTYETYLHLNDHNTKKWHLKKKKTTTKMGLYFRSC